jgi:hypothetical protein
MPSNEGHGKIDAARFALVEEMLAGLASDAQITAAVVERFQVKSRAARRCIRLVRSALVTASTKDLVTRRAEILHALEGIFGRAMEHKPEPYLKVALEALSQISRLLGLDAPLKVQQVAGLDFGNDGVITQERLEEMQAEKGGDPGDSGGKVN